MPAKLKLPLPNNNLDMPSHEDFMKLALEEAKRAAIADEVPVGAIVVMKGSIIGRGHNQTELLNDVTAHAEIIALTAAFNFLGSKYLPEASLYVTVEPCLMCAGALYWSKIGTVVFGAADVKNGYTCHCAQSPFHPKTQLISGILSEACSEQIRDFFKQKRRK